MWDLGNVLISPKTEIEEKAHFFFLVGVGRGFPLFIFCFWGWGVGERPGTVHRTEGMI